MKRFAKLRRLFSLLLFAVCVVAAIRVKAQTFTTLYNFTGGNDGGYPQAGLTLSGKTLYGTASQYGSLGNGTVFKLNTDGTSFATLHSFAGSPSDGATPLAGLVLLGNTLFGTASSGGGDGYGAAFAVNTDGSGFASFYSFNPSVTLNGGNPVAGLVSSGDTLYGTTPIGGYYRLGTVFKVNTDGSGFFLKQFNGGDGATPLAGLILFGGGLYGTTQQGGSSGNGTVFEVSPAGAGYGFATLHSFTPLSGPNPSINSDGASPIAGLILSGTTLYGTAQYGGTSGNGTVFKLNTDGTGFTTLHTFNGANDGANPSGGLILSGSTLYGTTPQGGASGSGTVFAVSTNGTGFTTLYNFTGGSDGANPVGGLILSSNTLYGTASAGGNLFFGTVFSVSLEPVNLPQLAIMSAGTNVILTWTNTALGFFLQSTTNLSSPVWTTNLPAPVVVNGQYTVTNPILGSQQFFRLAQ